MNPGDEKPVKTGPSGRAIVLWGLGMLLVLALAWSAGTVATTFFQVRAVVRECMVGELELRAALRRLGGCERALPKLRLYLHMPRATAHPHEKGCAAYLAGFCGRDSLPTLLGALRDRDWELRFWAAKALCRTDQAAFAAPALLRALNDPESHVRRVAAEAIENACWRMRQRAAGSPEGPSRGEPREGDFFPRDELMIPDFPGPTLELFELQVKLPGRGAGPESRKLVPALLKALGDPYARVRETAARALGTIGQEAGGAVPALVKLSADPARGVRVAALGALIRLREAGLGTVPRISGGASDPDPEVRQMAIRFLRGSSLPVKEIVAALEKALRDKNGWVRDNASWELGEIGPPARGAVPALEAALHDPEPFPRIAAALALIKIDQGNKKAVPALVKVLEHGNPGVRSSAAHALGDMGRRAGRAVASLEKLLRDSDPDVRQGAREALKKIRAAQGQAK